MIMGGCGFLGSWLTRSLLEEQNDVVLFDLRPKTSRLLEGISQRVKMQRGDITSREQVRVALKKFKPQVVVHYAALLSASAEADPARGYRVDIESTWPFLDEARASDVDCILFASSIAAYGPGVKIARENIHSPPTTIYGISKIFGEMAGMWFCRRYGIQFSSLRYSSVIGPGRSNGGASAYSSLVIQKPAQGEPYSVNVPASTKTPLVYVKDMTHATLTVYKNIRSLDYRIFNVASINPTVLQLISAVKRYSPQAKIGFQVDEDVAAIVKTWPAEMDVSRLRSIGWRPIFGNIDMLVTDFMDEVRCRPDMYRI